MLLPTRVVNFTDLLEQDIKQGECFLLLSEAVKSDISQCLCTIVTVRCKLCYYVKKVHI